MRSLTISDPAFLNPTIFRDTFERADASTWSSPWTESGSFAIASNEGKITSDSGGSVSIVAATVDVGIVAKVMLWVFSTAARGPTYCIIRYTDTNNMLFFSGSNSAGSDVYLISRASGTATVIASASVGPAWGNNSLIRVEDTGSNVNIVIDGVQRLSHATTLHNTATRCGIGGNAQSSGSGSAPRLQTMRADDFKILRF